MRCSKASKTWGLADVWNCFPDVWKKTDIIGSATDFCPSDTSAEGHVRYPRSAQMSLDMFRQFHWVPGIEVNRFLDEPVSLHCLWKEPSELAWMYIWSDESSLEAAKWPSLALLDLVLSWSMQFPSYRPCIPQSYLCICTWEFSWTVRLPVAGPQWEPDENQVIENFCSYKVVMWLFSRIVTGQG